MPSDSSTELMLTKDNRGHSSPKPRRVLKTNQPEKTFRDNNDLQYRPRDAGGTSTFCKYGRNLGGRNNEHCINSCLDNWIYAQNAPI